MGNRTFIIAAALAATVAIAATPAAAAPVTATVDAGGKAVILVPLTLTKIDDLDFGTVVSPGGGNLTIAPDTSARTSGPGVLLVPSNVGKRAYFGGAGSPSQQVDITVAAPATLTNLNGDTITVVGLTLDGAPTRTIDPVTRAFFVGVGGTLSLAANQPEGDYSATFAMTANYQ